MRRRLATVQCVTFLLVNDFVFTSYDEKDNSISRLSSQSLKLVSFPPSFPCFVFFLSRSALSFDLCACFRLRSEPSRVLSFSLFLSFDFGFFFGGFYVFVLMGGSACLSCAVAGARRVCRSLFEATRLLASDTWCRALKSLFCVLTLMSQRYLIDLFLFQHVIYWNRSQKFPYIFVLERSLSLCT